MDASKLFLVVLLSLVAFLTAVKADCVSQVLGDPYPDDDVVTVTNGPIITEISLKENYPNSTQKNIRIAVFNCDEYVEPTITSFTIGSNTSLGLDIETNNNNISYLVVKYAQDYENSGQREYQFDGKVAGTAYYVYLRVVNVDDVSPLFVAQGTTTCEIKETQIGQSSCFLLAKDDDAIMNNMKFRVKEGVQESENISLVSANTNKCDSPTAKDCITVAINIKAELEFVTKPVYSLSLEVEDQAGHIGNLSYVVQVIAENKDSPHFTPVQLTIEVDEETPGIIVNNGATITVADRDALDYGQFNIALEGNGSDNCYRAFDVIPKTAYRNTDVRLSVTNPEMLDYEMGSCNDIIVKIKATEVSDVNHTGEAVVNVKLRDINDEFPVFEHEEYVFSTCEHTPKNTHLGFVKANDLDSFARVTYSMTGTSDLTVDPVNGSVMVNADFNYERQQQIFATVRADDRNTSAQFDYTQIVVNITDINDEKPTLVVPWSPTNINENKTGIVLDVNVTASDPDTDPDLSFSIDWDTSRAAKQGLPVDKEKFKGCLKIDTDPDPENSKGVKAVLTVNGTIDWEVFDTLYVSIVAEDKNTHPDYEENRFSIAVTLTVQINDINDCAPEFSDIPKLVFEENSKEDILFGVISAKDKDGPENNNVTYYLVNELYEEEYVKIHPLWGEMRTGNDTIDFEKIEKIYYTVVATDGELETNISITIEIQDVNDNKPYFIGDYSSPIQIPENQNSSLALVKIEARDDDSSPEFNTLKFFVENKYKGIFEIDPDSGQMNVSEGAGKYLDYEGTNILTVEIMVKDGCQNEDCSFGNSLSNTTKVTVQLTDVNDNPPVFRVKSFQFTISEDTGKPEVQLGFVNATDDDSGINADLTFSFVDFNPEKGQELFSIIKVDRLKASVKVKTDLLDNCDEYILKINTSDIDNLTDTAELTIVVTDVNNNAPLFVFPNETTVLKFYISGNTPGSVLTDITEKKMIFSAVDSKDKGPNGTDGMIYSVLGDDTAMTYLEMVDNELRLKKDFDSNMVKKFKLQLQARDGEFEGAYQYNEIETDVTVILNIPFEPTFDELEWTTDFSENKTGLSELRKIEVGVTDKNNEEGCEDMKEDCVKDDIYYFISDGDTNFFKLAPTTGELSLQQELDREEKDTYSLVVVITNHQDGPHGIAADNSKLHITINVTDVFDTPPQFTKSLFAAGINIGDQIDGFVTNFSATDIDLSDFLTYQIVADSMTVTDTSLQNLMNNNPFKIKDNQLLLNINVQGSSLTGMFKFDVQVMDLGNLTDKAPCQVYIISEENFVSMTFKNNLTFVESKESQIIDIYTEVFKNQGNVKKVSSSVNSEGIQIEDQTEVTSYFVDKEKEQPINKDDITRELTNKQTYSTLLSRLQAQNLELMGIDQSADQSAVTNMEGVLQTVLIVVSVVLGTLVVALFTAFFIRTRSLNRRLEALSTTKFGSQSSDLNRIGLAVPNTNAHAVEGSNPVWGNEELVQSHFDNVSLSSGDSDLIGVEENPEFSPYGNSGLANDGFTPEFSTGQRMSINPLVGSGLNPLSTAALQESSAIGGAVNTLEGMQDSDGYDSENDSRTDSYTDVGQNSNFTFFGRMDSIPTTEL